MNTSSPSDRRRNRRTRKPRLGVFKLASCDGCQLTLLDCEDELLTIAQALQIDHFPEASSRMGEDGPFELALIEGSVSTPEQREEVQHIRARSQTLITIGACATVGGIQGLRNFADVDEYTSAVYAHPEYIESLAKSTPVAEIVKVDYALRGCPIDKDQLLEVLAAFLTGRKPDIPDEPVCMECKRNATVCVMVASDEPCLGPVTHAGCGAICPRMARGCFGCFGPQGEPNTRSLARLFASRGMADEEILRRFRGITSWADAFREESQRHE